MVNRRIPLPEGGGCHEAAREGREPSIATPHPSPASRDAPTSLVRKRIFPGVFPLSSLWRQILVWDVVNRQCGAILLLIQVAQVAIHIAFRAMKLSI